MGSEDEKAGLVEGQSGFVKVYTNGWDHCCLFFAVVVEVMLRDLVNDERHRETLRERESTSEALLDSFGAFLVYFP